MLEHMKNYDELMRKATSWLEPEGLLFTQILCHREFTYSFNTKQGFDTEWMAQNFFDRGDNATIRFIFVFSLLITGILVASTYYSKTLEARLKQLVDKKDDAMKVLEKAYGCEEAPQQQFTWGCFLCIAQRYLDSEMEMNGL